LLRHERPLQPGREPSAAAPTQAGVLHLADDPAGALGKERLGVVPPAARAGAAQAPVVGAIEICENPVFVGEHQDFLLESRIGAFGTPASWMFAGSPGFLALVSLNAGSRLARPLPPA